MYRRTSLQIAGDFLRRKRSLDAQSAAGPEMLQRQRSVAPVRRRVIRSLLVARLSLKCRTLARSLQFSCADRGAKAAASDSYRE